MAYRTYLEWGLLGATAPLAELEGPAKGQGPTSVNHLLISCWRLVASSTLRFSHLYLQSNPPRINIPNFQSQKSKTPQPFHTRKPPTKSRESSTNSDSRWRRRLRNLYCRAWTTGITHGTARSDALESGWAAQQSQDGGINTEHGVRLCRRVRGLCWRCTPGVLLHRPHDLAILSSTTDYARVYSGPDFLRSMAPGLHRPACSDRSGIQRRDRR